MQSGKIGHFDVRFVKERIFMKTLKDLGDLKGKRVLVRADFNVPLDGTTITDDGRIKAALPTIKTLREEGAKVILMAHLGRPKGKVVPELSLAPVAARLGELLGANVPLAKDTYGEDAQAKVAAMNDGDVVLLENVRFNPEETSKDADERAAYAKKIAALGEAFVSDGFGVVHRAQGSNYDVAADLPAAAGLLVEKEVKALSKATENPERPFTVVLGGSKVSDKLGVIENLLDKANRLEDLINEFFEITRFNLSAIELQYGAADLSRLLEQLTFEFQPMLREKNLTCALSTPETFPIRCDANKLQRVFDNLLRNAVLYCYPGTEITVTAERVGNFAVVRFRNCGDTIPPEKLSRIFEQFYRLDTARSSTGGAGLGLAIARQITQLHGGSLTGESRDDTVTFTVTLPIEKSAVGKS
mgnify:CR=1 FL=1